MVTVKLSKTKDRLEVYDDDGLYWYSITTDDISECGLYLKESNQIIKNHLPVQTIVETINNIRNHLESPPVSGDADHCYGCATMRHPCSDEVIL